MPGLERCSGMRREYAPSVCRKDTPPLALEMNLVLCHAPHEAAPNDLLTIGATNTIIKMANWMASLETPEMKTIITHTQELTTVLSSDPDLIAGALLSTKFIQDDSMLKILSGETPAGKAAILVEAVRNEIEVAPEKFSEFLDILSEQSWTKEVVESIFFHLPK